jgi:hypothetical protein
MPASRLSGQSGIRLEEKLSTRIAEQVEQRLRLFVAVRDMKIGEVVNGALDRHLPSLEDLAAELEQLAELARDDCPTKNDAPGQPLTSEEIH